MGFRFLRLERVLGYKQFNKETHTEYPNQPLGWKRGFTKIKYKLKNQDRTNIKL